MIVPALDLDVAEEDWPRIGLDAVRGAGGQHSYQSTVPPTVPHGFYFVVILDERHLKREGALDECSIPNRVE